MLHNQLDRIQIKRKLFTSHYGESLFDFICGEFLGDGQSRWVFEHALDDNKVVKIQKKGGVQNAIEFDLWNSMFHHENKKWLAPCYELSDDCLFLIQHRTKPVPLHIECPKSLPQFMTDIKRSNFGMIGKKMVMHDYANNLCDNYAMSNKMRKIYPKHWEQDW